MGDDGGDDEFSSGFERREVFLLLTGPGPEGLVKDASDVGESGIRERSAMSHGLVNSGEASRLDIHGRSSKEGVEAAMRKFER